MQRIESNADIAPCLSVVMPAYNEAATIEKAVAAVLEQRPVQELIIVDDGSQDGTRDILARLAEAAPRIRLFIQGRNQGKGAALRKGFAQASAPYVIVQDADLEYDP
ncbi:MAG: glycosyltransferase family 2 protein, partial [Methylococcaceae bacterium]|nr:glycosyltransferase family 2 protein [Methylococcaceae bacterium]